jgi:hypothetical protein
MRPPHRLRWTLFVAALAHGALAAVKWPVRSRPPVATPALDVATWTEIETEPAPPPPPAPPPEPTPDVTPSTPVSPAVATGRRPPEPAHAVPEVVAISPSAAPASPGWTIPVAVPSAAAPLGSLAGDHVSDAVRRGIAETVTQSAERKAAAHTLDGLHDRDLGLGLVPGGLLVTLARDATFRSLIPTNSRGVLAFETDATGAVLSGHVVDAPSANADWEALAAEVVTLARGKTLTGVGATGAVLTIEVVSALKNSEGVTQTGKPASFLDKVGAVAGAIADPLGTIAAHSVPLRRVVSAHVVEVHAR